MRLRWEDDFIGTIHPKISIDAVVVRNRVQVPEFSKLVGSRAIDELSNVEMVWYKHKYQALNQTCYIRRDLPVFAGTV